jgi:hypothetical protein
MYECEKTIVKYLENSNPDPCAVSCLIGYRDTLELWPQRLGLDGVAKLLPDGSGPKEDNNFFKTKM